MGVRAGTVGHPHRRADLDAGRHPRAAGDRPGDGGQPGVRAVRVLHRQRAGVRRRVHELHALLLPRLGQRLYAGRRRDDRPHRRRRQRGRLPGAHRQPRLPARAGRDAVRRAGRRQRGLAAGRCADLLVHRGAGPARRPAVAGAARRGERQGTARGLHISLHQRFCHPEQAGLLLAQRRDQLAAARPGARGGGRLLAGRQPVGDHGPRHGPGHRRAARGRHRLADGDAGGRRAVAGSATWA